jgi:hypothetical protein
MFRKHLIILGIILITLGSSAQDFEYTLSDDSLVNYHTSQRKVYHVTG